MIKTVMLAALAFLLNQSSFAQISDAKEPYWMVYTDAFTKETRVNFFNAERHLVYQEVLPGKYIKLTHRNKNALNSVLLQVMKNNLVASNTKLEELKEPVKRIRKKLNVNLIIDDNWHYNSTIIHDSWLQVNVQNSKGKKISIKLFNSRGEPMFAWWFMHTKYKIYNLEPHLSGVYQLVVSDGQRSFSQDIRVSNVPLQCVIINKQTPN